MPKKYYKTAQQNYLESIKGKVLDEYLANGWYRMGPYIFTSHFINYETTLYSTIWLRTVIEDYKLSKSLRKIAKKNKDHFSYVIEPYSYAEELDVLYNAYSSTFKGALPNSLSDYLMNSLESDIYDTKLVKVYKENKLIACSIFDCGDDTIASIFGFYDPAYSTMSLGLYTMLLEVEFCQAQDMKYYYMGYFVPGNPRFDYKLRVGNMEFLEMKSGKWKDIKHFDYDKTPLKINQSKLSLLQEILSSEYKSTILKNAFIDAHIIEYFPMRYVEAPLILFFDNLEISLQSATEIICTYDIFSDKYMLLQCHLVDSFYSNYNPDWIERLDDKTNKQSMVIRKIIKSCKTPLPILRWLDKNNLISI